MRFTVEISGAARRRLKKVNRAAKQKILDKIKSLAENPRPHGYKHLTDVDNTYRVRVGDYRIIYEIEDRALIVLILKVADRNEGTYKKL